MSEEIVKENKDLNENKDVNEIKEANENKDTNENKNISKNIDDIIVEKKMRNKKIGFIATLAVTAVLVLAIVISACISIDLRATFIKDPDSITIYSTDISSGFALLDKNSDDYKDFLSAYKNMFKINSLSALFNGNNGNYDSEIDETLDAFNEDNLKSDLGSHYVKFSYEQPQQILKSNGKKYQSKYNSKYNLTFDTIFFSFDDENVLKPITFYLVVKGNRISSSSTELKSITKINISGNTYGMYKKLESFKTK